MITAYATEQPFDHIGLYRAFLERENDCTGTVVLRHGRVKRPGKHMPEFSTVELKAITGDVNERLAAIPQVRHSAILTSISREPKTVLIFLLR